MEGGAAEVKLKFQSGLAPSDPQQTPVLIVGQLKNLTAVKFETIKVKLEPRVSEEVYQSALSSLHPVPTDSVSLYLNLATLAALPVKCSRHNAPARPHALTKLVKAASAGIDEFIVVVCEREDVVASACAVARAYPMYSRKTQRASGRGIGSTVSVTIEFIIVGEDNNSLMLTDQDLSTLETLAYGVRTAARIVDMPCSEMNVSAFLDEVNKVGMALGIMSKVIRGEELKEKGMGGIYGVGKAATCPPALAVLSHTPPGATQTIAWVGKGIVYDSGGLSIKSKTEMPGMKRDCGGAAGILGAFYAVVKQGFTQNLHAIFCLAENSVGPNSTRPDDIHTFYSGRTVEINNTDAEGRMVLADGVVFAAKDLNATLILDMATLTGAQAISTGKYHGAILTNSPDWEEHALQAGRMSGDLVFPLVYCPEMHFVEFASAVADMKNSVADRNNAQSSCAGLFIAAHLGFDFPGIWIHIDMASPVHCGERATGYGVGLLASLFGGFSSDKLLKSVGQSTTIECVSGEDGSVSKKVKRN